MEYLSFATTITQPTGKFQCFVHIADALLELP